VRKRPSRERTKKEKKGAWEKKVGVDIYDKEKW